MEKSCLSAHGSSPPYLPPSSDLPPTETFAQESSPTHSPGELAPKCSSQITHLRSGPKLKLCQNLVTELFTLVQSAAVMSLNFAWVLNVSGSNFISHMKLSNAQCLKTSAPEFLAGSGPQCYS